VRSGSAKARGGPRGAAAAVKRRSLKSGQGGPLPEDGSPIADYPVGSCVLLDPGGWHLVRFRIGGTGLPHLGRLSAPPDGPGWNARMGEARIADPDSVVRSSCWPYRESADGATGESGDDDPLALAPAEGSLMLNHLRGARGGPGPGPDPDEDLGARGP